MSSLVVLTADTPMAKAKFVGGGPINGRRDLSVPRFGPAWVRWHTPDGAVAWYGHKKATARTYVYVDPKPTKS